MKTYILTLLSFLLLAAGPQVALAQDILNLTLKQAQDYALENSFSARISELEIDKASRQVKQTAALGLPQANAKLDYQQFLEIPTQLLPGELVGQPTGTFVPVQFGTEYNVTASATVSQLIFDGSFFVGLQAARAYAQFIEEQQNKTKTDVVDQATNAYYMALTARENVSIISQTRETLNKTFEDTKVIYDNGFAEKQDVDQLRLSLADLDNRIAYADNQAAIALNLLKFQIGASPETQVQLVDELDGLSTQDDGMQLLAQAFDVQKNIDYKLNNSSIGLLELQLKLEKSKALPNLAAFYNYQRNAQRSKFNFLDNDEQWFPTQLVGVTLNVPIFSGLGRFQSQKMAQIEIDQALIRQEQVAHGVQLEYETAKAEYQFALENKQAQVENMKLAEDIFNTSQIKYKEGVGSSFELTQAKNQMLTKQGEYINSLLQLLNTKNRLNKALSNY